MADYNKPKKDKLILKDKILEYSSSAPSKRVNFSVEPSNTKDYDILLMTGNSENMKGSDKK